MVLHDLCDQRRSVLRGWPREEVEGQASIRVMHGMDREDLGVLSAKCPFMAVGNRRAEHRSWGFLGG